MSTKRKTAVKDFDLIINFTIPGHPATKKNSNRIIWTKVAGRRLPKVIPSKQYYTYEKSCKPHITSFWKEAPIDYGVLIRIKVWLSAWRIPDHVGILQSLGDIFQTCKFIKDDKYIQWTDYNFETKEIDQWFAGVDKENPRVEVWVYRYKTTSEIYETEIRKKK